MTINCSPPVSQFQVWVSINFGAELLMSASKTSFVHWIAVNKTYTFSLYDYTGGVKGAKLDSITVTGISSTGEEVGRKGTAWEYDCAGNMTRIEQYIGGQMHDFQDLEYDLANRLWKKCRVTYENDANGNRTSRTLDSRVMGYSYDGENRLTQVTKNGVGVLDNVYDGSGMRIKEVKGGQATYFVYQGNNPLMEYTPSNGKYKYFIYAGNKIVAEEMDGVVKYYQTDHLGSTRAITDAAGNKVAEYKFKPYGEKDSSSGPFSTDYQFTGKPLDTEVGLSYFGARFYDPETGRFLTRDPAKDGQNWYAYCNNNPLKYVDPDGRRVENLCSFNYSHTFTRQEDPGLFGKAVSGFYAWVGDLLDPEGVVAVVSAMVGTSDYEKMLGPLGVGIVPEAEYTFTQSTEITGDFEGDQAKSITVKTSWSYTNGSDSLSGDFTATFTRDYYDPYGCDVWLYENENEDICYPTFEGLWDDVSSVYDDTDYENQY